MYKVTIADLETDCGAWDTDENLATAVYTAVRNSRAYTIKALLVGIVAEVLADGEENDNLLTEGLTIDDVYALLNWLKTTLGNQDVPINVRELVQKALRLNKLPNDPE